MTYRLLLFLTFLFSYAYGQCNFTVSGEITGLEDGTPIRLYFDGYAYFASDTTSIASGIANNGKFQLAGTLDSNGTSCVIRMKKEGVFLARIYVDSSSKIVLKGRIDKLKDITVSDRGGLGTIVDMHKYIDLMSPLLKQLKLPHANKKSVYANILTTQKKFIQNNRSSYYAPCILLRAFDDLIAHFGNWNEGTTFSMPFDDVRSLYNLLDTRAKSGFAGKQLTSAIEQMETLLTVRTLSSDINEEFPEIKFLTYTGDSSSVDQVYKKNNSELSILLLWHPGQREANYLFMTLLNRLIKKYPESKLCPISIDRVCGKFLFDRNSIVSELEINSGEKILWHQLIDLRNQNGCCSDDCSSSFAQIFFKADRVPFLALLDRNGRIIAKGLNIKEAEQKIKEILGE